MVAGNRGQPRIFMDARHVECEVEGERLRDGVGFRCKEIDEKCNVPQATRINSIIGSLRVAILQGRRFENRLPLNTKEEREDFDKKPPSDNSWKTRLLSEDGKSRQTKKRTDRCSQKEHNLRTIFYK